MYRDEELNVNEEYEDLRKSKCFNPCMPSNFHGMLCPMQMQMMQQPMMQMPMPQMPMMQQPWQSSGQCPICGKPMNFRDDEDYDYDYDYGDYDDRDSYSRRPNYHHFKNYYPPYFKHFMPYHHYGPWWMKRDFEE